MVNITTTYDGDVDKLWPRRLLDTISMTSFERQDDNVYNNDREPSYSIMSYTWGRFALEPAPSEAERLPVAGITWQIPAIDPKYFSAAQFRQVIQSTREMSGNRFLWLDVACIDQEDYAAKMEEIGRQAGIFANAGMTFVWLWTVPLEALQSSSRTILAVNREWSWQESEVELARLKNAICAVFDDYWFTSLWTLQEEGLRPDARILPLDAETSLPHTYLQWLNLGFRHTLALVGESAWRSSLHNPQMIADAEQIELRIRQAGYLNMPGANPNQRFTQARSRKTKNEVDRIYGIMALYNMQVGAAVPGADVSQPYSLDDLEGEFAVALNAKSALLAQLFVHVEKPPLGKSWQITQNGMVPEEFRDWGPEYVTCDDCVINAVPTGPAQLSAGIASFNSLVVFWKALVQETPDYLKRDKLVVVVDDYLCREHISLPSSDPYHDRFTPLGYFERTNRTVNALIETFGDSRLSVIRLGGKRRRGSNGFAVAFGLLILHDGDDRGRCRRIGLCQWEGDSPYGRLPSKDVETLRPRFEEIYSGTLY